MLTKRPNALDFMFTYLVAFLQIQCNIRRVQLVLARFPFLEISSRNGKNHEAVDCGGQKRFR